MKFAYISCLTGRETAETSAPWEIPLKPNPPFASKKSRAKHWQNPECGRAFISLCSGRCPTVRISSENPVESIRGFIADYDDLPFQLSSVGEVEDALREGLRLGMLAPNYWYFTTSGRGIRLIWLFESEAKVLTIPHGERFLEHCAKSLKANKIFGDSLDKQSCDPTQYFEVGEGWKAFHGEPVPMNLVRKWEYAVFSKLKRSEKHGFPEAGKDFSWETLVEGLAKKFPDCGVNWSEFEVGNSRFRRFWDPDADNESAVRIFDTGCYSFTGTGSAFKSWASLLGDSWIRKHVGDIDDSVTKDIYYCHPQYWLNVAGIWEPRGRENISLNFRMAGLSPSKENVAQSQVETAMHRIENLQSVQAVIPLIYTTETVVSHNGRRILNTSQYRLPLFSPERVTFQDTLRFCPATWDFRLNLNQTSLNAVGTPNLIQLWNQVYWEAWAIQGMLAGDWHRGQAVILMGPVGAGKNFYSHHVLGPLFNTKPENAAGYLTGEETFNGNLFASPLWTCHDIVKKSRASAAVLSQMVKAVVANDTFTYREMYRPPWTIPWSGRLVIGLNDTAGGVEMLPRLEDSVQDKLNLWVVAGNFSKAIDVEAIKREVYHFGAFLRDLEIPEEWRDVRWGVKSWHHPALVTQMENNSDYSWIEQVLATFVSQLSARRRLSGKELFLELSNDIEYGHHLKDAGINHAKFPNLVRDLIRRGCVFMELGTQSRITLDPDAAKKLLRHEDLV